MEDMWKETNCKLTSATTSAVSWNVQEIPKKYLYKVGGASQCSLLHSPVTFSLLGINTFLSTLFLNTLSLRSTLDVTDQVSYPYKKRDKTVVLCVLIFTILDGFWTDW